MGELVGVVMGSQTDWEVMRHAVQVLVEFDVPHEVRIVSAHRTPDLLMEYAGNAVGRGLEVIIAGAGGAAHLPGMIASKTRIPVLGVPIKSKSLQGIDSLLSIVQMPKGIPVSTFAIDGAVNAALFAIAILANKYKNYGWQLDNYRNKMTMEVLNHPDPRKTNDFIDKKPDSN